jgi:hypothetical protein
MRLESRYALIKGVGSDVHQAWTRLILFANTFCRSALGKSLCTYKSCCKWCPRSNNAPSRYRNPHPKFTMTFRTHSRKLCVPKIGRCLAIYGAKFREYLCIDSAVWRGKCRYSAMIFNPMKLFSSCEVNGCCDCNCTAFYENLRFCGLYPEQDRPIHTLAISQTYFRFVLIYSKNSLFLLQPTWPELGIWHNVLFCL